MERSIAERPAHHGHPARERGRIKTGNYGPSLPDSPRLLPRHSCQRFGPGPTWAGPELREHSPNSERSKKGFLEIRRSLSRGSSYVASLSMVCSIPEI